MLQRSRYLVSPLSSSKGGSSKLRSSQGMESQALLTTTRRPLAQLNIVIVDGRLLRFLNEIKSGPIIEINTLPEDVRRDYERRFRPPSARRCCIIM